MFPAPYPFPQQLWVLTPGFSCGVTIAAVAAADLCHVSSFVDRHDSFLWQAAQGSLNKVILSAEMWLKQWLFPGLPGARGAWTSTFHRQ